MAETFSSPPGGSVNEQGKKALDLEAIRRGVFPLSESVSLLVFEVSSLRERLAEVQRDATYLRVELRRAASDLNDWEEYREEYPWQQCAHEDAWLDEERCCRHCGAVIPRDDATEITAGRPWYVSPSGYYRAIADGQKSPGQQFDETLAGSLVPLSEAPEEKT